MGEQGYIYLHMSVTLKGIDSRGTEMDGPKQPGSGWVVRAAGQVTDWGRGGEVMLYLQVRCFNSALGWWWFPEVMG